MIWPKMSIIPWLRNTELGKRKKKTTSQDQWWETQAEKTTEDHAKLYRPCQGVLGFLKSKVEKIKGFKRNWG